MIFHAPLHHEDGRVWTEVAELPGCYALSDSVAGLAAALPDAIRDYRDAPSLPVTTTVGEAEVLVTAG